MPAVLWIFLLAAPWRLEAQVPPNDWLYVLQIDGAGGVAALAASNFDVLVIDYSTDGGASGELTPAELSQLKASGKTVLAYFSIGEAETYRFYWNDTWNDDPTPDPDAPSWLGPFNPLFPDNYKVRYWQSGWQDVLFGQNGDYLDRIVAQGFDGVYLDIVDAFELWSFEQVELTRLQARQHMVDLITDLANHARATLPGFLVYPQNAEDLVLDDEGELDALGTTYLQLIDGIGIEDLFYSETTPQSTESIDYRLSVLQHYLNAGHQVLTVDYVWDPSTPSVALHDDFHTRCINEGLIPYTGVSDRDLDEILVIGAGQGAVHEQPKADSDVIFADGFESGDTSAW